jgi:uncharacterized protein YbjT (DUF2867 family)
MRIVVVGGTGLAGRHLVDALRSAGADAIPASRATGVDVTTGAGLDEALAGAQRVVDLSTTASPEEAEARAFFRAAGQNLQESAERAGVERLVVLSIVGVDRLSGGYGAAKLEQERAVQSGAVPALIVRSTQFHELLYRMMDWGRQGGVWWVPEQLIQPIAVAAMARALAGLVLNEEPPGIVEVAGPHQEQLVDMAVRLAARRGETVEVKGVPDDSPDGLAFRGGALLPGPNATIIGPTFQQWLDAGEREP